MKIAIEFLALMAMFLWGNVEGGPLSRSRKLQESSGEVIEKEYLEQCSVVNFRGQQLRHVNVLAFFDADWTLSHRQAAL